MSGYYRLIFLFAGYFFLNTTNIRAQVNGLQIDPVKEKMYRPYMLWRHQGEEGLEAFRKEHPHAYMQELWYYSQSFYIKRNYLQEGAELDASIIAIDRFESQREDDTEKLIILPGFRDALVLLPSRSLLYKPKP
ncbi:MAG TPA: hypothetical protein PLQ93_12265 [Bacteroidia bacterium]|nr:hypothetical protein [Bacteroidia bacterium]